MALLAAFLESRIPGSEFAADWTHLSHVWAEVAWIEAAGLPSDILIRFVHLLQSSREVISPAEELNL